jgi:hypothetical protein
VNKECHRLWSASTTLDEYILQDSQSASLNLSKVAGIFYILLAGMIGAMCAACAELFYRARVETKHTTVSDRMSHIAVC